MSNFTPTLLSLEELVATGLSYEQKLNHLVIPRTKQRLTKSMFWDHRHLPNYSDEVVGRMIYTLSDCRPDYYLLGEDNLPRYDLKQLYMAIDDHTEYEFIKRFMWDEYHWNKLCDTYFFKPVIAKWRKELRHKIKSKMYDVILTDALDVGSKTKITSARYLLEKYYDPASSKKDNRQSKKEKEKDNLVLIEDHKRLLEGFKSETKVN